jgi:hypothetical protein
MTSFHRCQHGEWKTPLYKLKTSAGKDVVIDVTTSVSAGLGPSRVLTEALIPFFNRHRVRRVLDFGAGSLRHTLPLLEAGFDVCAVEFESGFQRPAQAEALMAAREYANFRELIWPHDFLDTSLRYDAVLLCYVLQTMPLPAERTLLLKALVKTLKDNAYCLYMSRFNQFPGAINAAQRVSDGYFMYPKRDVHSFYREFSTGETHAMMRKLGFHQLRYLSERGTDQMFLYGKGRVTWP